MFTSLSFSFYSDRTIAHSFPLLLQGLLDELEHREHDFLNLAECSSIEGCA